MSSSLGPSDFFALEAGEYLERLGTIVENPDGPKRDEFVRFARALRGSALMANQTDFASAAAGLEAIARAYRDGTLKWSAGTKESAAQGVEDLKLLLRQAGTWSQEQSHRADRLARDLERVAGQAVPTTQRRAADGRALNTGVRAFIAREGALIASALERAGRTLAAEPTNTEVVHNVVRRMQALRGLAELTDLSPLPEMLDGLELASSTLTRTPAPPPEVAEIFHSAAIAMTRASRDVADQGRPDPDTEEAQRFSTLLIGAFALEEDVVDIGTLAPDHEESIATPGSPPVAVGSLAAVDLVSQGEHLTAMADTLSSASSRVERELRLYIVIDTLLALDRKAGAEVSGAFSVFAFAARRQLADVDSTEGVAAFGQHLREAGDLMRTGPAAGGQATVSRLRSLSERLEEGQAVPAPAAAPVVETPKPAAVTADPEKTIADDEVIVSIADLAPNEPDVQPLAPAVPPAAPVGILGDPGGIVDQPGLAGSLATYYRLRQKSDSAGAPSLDWLLGGTPAPEAARPADTVVEIDTLLYRGASAQKRARALGTQINESLAHPKVLEGLRPLLEELIDLLPLAAEPVVG